MMATTVPVQLIQQNMFAFHHFAAHKNCVESGCISVRICIYKSDEVPHITLFLREGSPLPAGARSQKWRHFKAVAREEVRADLLKQIEVGNGHVFVQLSATP